METETIIDEKGRICIPATLRKKLNLNAGEKIMMRIDEKQNLVIQRTTTPAEFIEQAKEFRKHIKKKTSKPLEVEKLF
jgi:AbrB family looped-hinge helix DNA binding protein